MNKRNYITNFDGVVDVKTNLVRLESTHHDPVLGTIHTPWHWRGVVDQFGGQLGNVTDQYHPIQNRTLFEALKAAAYDLGVGTIDKGRAMYQGGRSLLEVKLPDTEFYVPGDPSPVTGTAVLKHDARGTGAVVLYLGILRLMCTNGMIRFFNHHTVRIPHTQSIGYGKVYAEVYKVLELVIGKANEQKEIASLLASTEMRSGVIDNLLEDTAKRYHSRLETTIENNTYELGSNLWALTQAISEVATHQMPTGWAAEQWATRNAQELVTVANTINQ